VANNAVIAKTLITDSITSNTLVRTTTINASGAAFVNGITSNTLVRTVNLNALGSSGYVAGGPKVWLEGANKIIKK
jgi:hypothetical protein